jgi:hypothetical protein
MVVRQRRSREVPNVGGNPGGAGKRSRLEMSPEPSSLDDNVDDGDNDQNDDQNDIHEDINREQGTDSDENSSLNCKMSEGAMIYYLNLIL